MKHVLLLCFVLVLINAKDLRLTDKQANTIAYKIWLNEGSGKNSKLVHVSIDYFVHKNVLMIIGLKLN